MKNTWYLALGLLLVLLLAGAAYGRLRPHSSAALPSQAQWAAALATSSNAAAQALVGTIVAVGDNSLTLSVQQPATIGSTAQVAFASSTPISKTVPKSPADMAAALKEFQRLQKESNGKPFAAPSSSDTVYLSLADLEVGTLVIVTLTPQSSLGHFSAASVQIVPAAGVSSAPPIP